MGYQTTNWLQGHGTVNSPDDAENALIWCQFASIEEGATILYDQFYFGTAYPGTPSF